MVPVLQIKINVLISSKIGRILLNVKNEKLLEEAV